MKSVNAERKSDLYSRMYGDAPKVASLSGKIQATREAIEQKAIKQEKPTSQSGRPFDAAADWNTKRKIP
jgi:hypothetical protein